MKLFGSGGQKFHGIMKLLGSGRQKFHDSMKLLGSGGQKFHDSMKLLGSGATRVVSGYLGKAATETTEATPGGHQDHLHTEDPKLLSERTFQARKCCTFEGGSN